MRRKRSFRKDALIDLPEEAEQMVIDVIKFHVDEIVWGDKIWLFLGKGSSIIGEITIFGDLGKSSIRNMLDDLKNDFGIDIDNDGFVFSGQDGFLDIFKSEILSVIKHQELDIVYDGFFVNYFPVTKDMSISVSYKIMGGSIIFER